MGQASLVFGLLEQEAGKSGQYGLASDAAANVPAAGDEVAAVRALRVRRRGRRRSRPRPCACCASARPAARPRWDRTNHAGRTVTLLEGPAYAVGAAVPPASLGAGPGPVRGRGGRGRSRRARRPRGRLEQQGAARATSARSPAVRSPPVRSRSLGLGLTGLASAALVDRGAAAARPGRAARPRSSTPSSVARVIAGTANLLNLLDLRPGRALKATMLLGALAADAAALGGRRGRRGRRRRRAAAARPGGRGDARRHRGQQRRRAARQPPWSSAAAGAGGSVAAGRAAALTLASREGLLHQGHRVGRRCCASSTPWGVDDPRRPPMTGRPAVGRPASVGRAAGAHRGRHAARADRRVSAAPWCSRRRVGAARGRRHLPDRQHAPQRRLRGRRRRRPGRRRRAAHRWPARRRAAARTPTAPRRRCSPGRCRAGAAVGCCWRARRPVAERRCSSGSRAAAGHADARRAHARGLRAAGRCSTAWASCWPGCCRRTAGSSPRRWRRCCPAWWSSRPTSPTASWPTPATTPADVSTRRRLGAGRWHHPRRGRAEPAAARARCAGRGTPAAHLTFPDGRGPPGRRRSPAPGVLALVAQQAAVAGDPVAHPPPRTRRHGVVNVYTYVQAVYLLPYAVLAVPIATSAFPALAHTAAEELRSRSGRSAGTPWPAPCGDPPAHRRAVAVLMAVARPVGVFFGSLDSAADAGGGAALAALPGALSAYAPGSWVSPWPRC